MNSPTRLPSPGEFTPQQHVLQLWLIVFLTSLGVSIVAVISWIFTPPIILDRHFLDGFTNDASAFYASQPGKNRAFVFSCLTFPAWLSLVCWGATTFVSRLEPPTVKRLLLSALGVTWLFFFSCLVPLFWCPQPPSDFMLPSWLLCTKLLFWHKLNNPAHFVALLVFIGLAGCLAANRFLQNHKLWVIASLLVLQVILIPGKVYSPSEIDDAFRFAGHFNPVVHSLSQVANGRHLWVDFSNNYGGYVEFLGPLLQILPRTLKTLLLLFPALNATAIFCLLMTVCVVIKDWRALLLTALSILGLQYVPDFMLDQEHYYQYYVVRQLFPALGLLTVALYLRGNGRWSYRIMTLIAAAAPIWNLDTGLVLWGSWIATLGIVAVAQRNWIKLVLDLSIQFAALILAWTLIWVYLRMATGHWPSAPLLFKFQSTFAGSGFFCVRLLFPDAWVIPVAVYIGALTWALLRALNRDATWRTYFIIFTSILGTGLLSYYFGRSMPSNLTMILYPAVLVTGVLWEDIRGFVTSQKLSGLAHAFLAPVIGFLGWWALMLIVALPDLALQSLKTIRIWNSDTPTPFLQNLEFVHAQTTPHEDIFILSCHSGFYYYETNTTYENMLPTTADLIWSGDIDLLEQDITQRRFAKLFVDDNFYTFAQYKPEVYVKIRKAISENYSIAATSSSGHLSLLKPRDKSGNPTQ